MSDQTCYICGGDSYHQRKGAVRDNDSLRVLECDGCGLVFLSSFDHINDAHYEQSGMHDDGVPDVDAWLAETKRDDERRFHFLENRLPGKSVLDFGCGNGGFLGLAKPVAGSVSGIELERALAPSFKARELNVFANLEDCKASGQKYDLLSAFHVVEHLPDPRAMLAELAQLLSDGGEMIVEVPSANDALLVYYDCAAFQNFTYWSQHLFLFNPSTFKTLVEQAGLRLNWINQVQRFPLSNHLYWLANGKPGGHDKWDELDSEDLIAAYQASLAKKGLCDTVMAGISAHG